MPICSYGACTKNLPESAMILHKGKYYCPAHYEEVSRATRSGNTGGGSGMFAVCAKCNTKVDLKDATKYNGRTYCPGCNPLAAKIQGATPKISCGTISTDKVKETTRVKLDLKNMFGGEIGRDTTGRFKLSMMGLAIMNGEGKWVAYNGTQMVDVLGTVTEIGGDMIFKMPTPTVTTGDLIISQGKPLYVKAVLENGSIECFDPMTDRLTTYVPQKNLFGFNYHIKVFSMLNLQQTAEGNPNTIMPLVFANLLEGGKGTDDPLTTMMLMSMFTGQPGGATNPLAAMNLNPMMIMLLSDRKGGDTGGLMEMMLMGQMFNGGAAANPFAGLCGCQTAARQAAPTTE